MDWKLLVTLIAVLATLAGILRGLASTRRDWLAVATLLTVSAILLGCLSPVASLGEYDDYKYFVNAVWGRWPDMPRPIYTWLLAGAPQLDRLFRFTWLLASTLPALTFLLARARPAPFAVAVGAALFVLMSSSFLVYGPGINAQTIFASCGLAALLLLDIAFRVRPTAAVIAVVLSCVLAHLAIASRDEAVFLAPVSLFVLIADGRRPRARRWWLVLAWLLPCVLIHVAYGADLWAATYSRTASRIHSHLPRLVATYQGFLPTNGIVVLIGLALWRGVKKREWPPLFIIAPALTWFLIYRAENDPARHQLFQVPFFATEAALAWPLLWSLRPRVALGVAAVAGILLGLSDYFLIQVAFFGVKQREFTELRAGAPSNETIYYAAYDRFDADPEAPLLATQADPARIVALAAPDGCPRDLFRVLMEVHQDCVESRDHREKCRRALPPDGDWVEQAASLVARKGSGASAHRALTVTPGPRTKDAVLFVPWWAKEHPPSEFFDIPAAELPEFRWMDALSLAVELPPDLHTSARSLMPVRVRSPEEARALCDAVAARPAGRALFSAIEAERGTGGH